MQKADTFPYIWMSWRLCVQRHRLYQILSSNLLYSYNAKILIVSILVVDLAYDANTRAPFANMG